MKNFDLIALICLLVAGSIAVWSWHEGNFGEAWPTIAIFCFLAVADLVPPGARNVINGVCTWLLLAGIPPMIIIFGPSWLAIASIAGIPLAAFFTSGWMFRECCFPNQSFKDHLRNCGWRPYGGTVGLALLWPLILPALIIRRLLFFWM